MGIDIHWVFQAKDNFEWVDIPTRYDGLRDTYLYLWLGTGEKPISHPGFPADFPVDEEYCHPVTNPEVLHAYEVEDCANSNEAPNRFMGLWGFAWLLGSEILNARIPVERMTIEIAVNDYNKWDKVSNPKYWDELDPDWQQQQDAKHYATPENITDDTKWVIVDWVYDFTDDFRYFVDEVRRLVTQYGDVRFVFGFA